MAKYHTIYYQSIEKFFPPVFTISELDRSAKLKVWHSNASPRAEDTSLPPFFMRTLYITKISEE
jgi:hypothetical protein